MLFSLERFSVLSFTLYVFSSSSSSSSSIFQCDFQTSRKWCGAFISSFFSVAVVVEKQLYRHIRTHTHTSTCLSIRIIKTTAHMPTVNNSTACANDWLNVSLCLLFMHFGETTKTTTTTSSNRKKFSFKSCCIYLFVCFLFQKKSPLCVFIQIQVLKVIRICFVLRLITEITLVHAKPSKGKVGTEKTCVRVTELKQPSNSKKKQLNTYILYFLSTYKQSNLRSVFKCFAHTQHTEYVLKIRQRSTYKTNRAMFHGKHRNAIVF